jgi:3'-phosphoadenosine 5'-phosphosulfate sulfotransferase (PAPS reductase)/FAD synthetase
MSEQKHTPEDLKIMQAWPLERKIQVSQTRIIEWYQHWGGKVSVSFSGGKDSSVLLDLARRCYPDIEAVFVDTGLEFPEVRAFALSHENVTVLRPAMRFDEVVQKYGWCYPSKDVARTLRYAKQGSQWALDRLVGVNADGSPSKFRQTHYARWAYLKDGPVQISDICCEIMKERPLAAYVKATGKQALVGTMATESRRRKQAWLLTGCNVFDSKRPVSKPLSFWTEQDILRYIKEFQLPYASVYGEIAEDKNGRLSTTGEQRTGCCFCPVGCHLDKENRFQRLAVTHPKLHDYVINQLGLRELLDFVGVKYR